ncbi:MAG TPA: CHRD domain-containing protein [Thermoanaerobaculia bacterium]|jgi:hypothetical protein|nr:CHRD domain-containing protein [Thermoanaerobaculia bacterium]
MRHFQGIAAFVVLVIAAVFAPAIHGQTLGAVLTGASEVPPNSSAGFGNATVTFDATRENIDVTITTTGLASVINNFHIHEAPPGVNGPVVVNLIGLGGTFVNGTMTGTFPIAADVAQRMLQNPANFYVNVHTVALPGGAVRGALAYVSGGSVTYAVELRPGREVPPANSAAFGSAFVTLDPVNNTIAWEAHASGIASPTMAHIHRGPAGVNGPVIINFATSPAEIAGGRTSGAGPISEVNTGNLTPADLTALSSASTANGYYVNIHSTAFPSGEVRGQLVPANEYDIAIAGRVTNGLGQTYVTDVRVFNPSYGDEVTALLEYFRADASHTTAQTSLVVNIRPRATVVLDDIAGPSRFNVTGTTGAIRVSSATPLAITSRVYVDLRSDQKGTFGQTVPAYPRASALRRGVMPHLSNRADRESGFRTNIGFFNPNTTEVSLRLELRDSSGQLVEQNTLTLSALSQQQHAIGTYFTTDLSAASNLTLSFDASSPVFGYAAVNDNVSGDSVFVPAQPDSGVGASQ